MLTTRRLAAAVALLGAIALAAGAVPAFTASTGSVSASVSVPAPPAPCLTLSGTSVDFGTQSFSDPGATGTPTVYASPAVRITSCSTGAEVISLGASAAATPLGATWTVPDTAAANTCSFGTNVYEPGYYLPSVANGRLYFYSLIPLPTFAPGGSADVTFSLQMPCRGSGGAGETAYILYSAFAAVT